jgi:hypothetical protein
MHIAAMRSSKTGRRFAIGVTAVLLIGGAALAASTASGVSLLGGERAVRSDTVKLPVNDTQLSYGWRPNFEHWSDEKAPFLTAATAAAQSIVQAIAIAPAGDPQKLTWSTAAPNLGVQLERYSSGLPQVMKDAQGDYAITWYVRHAAGQKENAYSGWAGIESTLTVVVDKDSALVGDVINLVQDQTTSLWSHTFLHVERPTGGQVDHSEIFSLNGASTTDDSQCRIYASMESLVKSGTASVLNLYPSKDDPHNLVFSALVALDDGMGAATCGS